MLLNEILTKPVKDIRTAKTSPDVFWNPEYDEYNPPKKLPHLGSGIQANAFHHGPSNTVLKQIELADGEADPAYQFIRIVLKHQNNPYFPKIHNIKVYKHENRVTQMIMRVERLHRVELDDAKKLFNLLGLTVDTTDFDLFDFSVELARDFEYRGNRLNMIRNAKDPQLAQALRLIEPLFNHYYADMHLGNIMVRPNGQLVITDPVAM